jgi:hypothetical protein
VRRAFLLALLPVLALVSGCGDRRVHPTDVALPLPPNGVHALGYPKAGLSLRAPNSWRSQEGTSPLVASIASGTATVALWRYPRTEPLPASAAAFQTAKRALVRAARARDRTLQVARARVIRFHGRPALEIVGVETVGGQRRMVRSTHVFRQGSEVVVEALAPPALFAGLDRTVFDPLLASLKIQPVPR